MIMESARIISYIDDGQWSKKSAVIDLITTD